MTPEGGGSIPFVGVFDIHVDLVSMPLEKKYIIHSLSPLESGTNHCPVILVVIDHVPDDYQELLDLFHSDYSLFLKRAGDDSASLLSFCLRYAYDLRAEYEKRNIPHEIFTDTMHDIILWSDEYRTRHGVPGLDEASASWLRRHLLLRLFRLGSLQFEEPELPLYGFWEGVELPSCDRILKVHIPASADISVNAAEESFRKALSFYSAESILFICSRRKTPKSVPVGSMIWSIMFLHQYCGQKPTPL